MSTIFWSVVIIPQNSLFSAFCSSPLAQSNMAATKHDQFRPHNCTYHAYWTMAEVCIICNGVSKDLAMCCDTKSWTTMYHAAVIQGHKDILDLSMEAVLVKIQQFIISAVKKQINVATQFMAI